MRSFNFTFSSLKFYVVVVGSLWPQISHWMDWKPVTRLNVDIVEEVQGGARPTSLGAACVNEHLYLLVILPLFTFPHRK